MDNITVEFESIILTVNEFEGKRIFKENIYFLINNSINVLRIDCRLTKVFIIFEAILEIVIERHINGEESWNPNEIPREPEIETPDALAFPNMLDQSKQIAFALCSGMADVESGPKHVEGRIKERVDEARNEGGFYVSAEGVGLSCC